MFEQEIGVHLKQIKTENLSKIRESFHKEIRRLSKETEAIKKNQVKITELWYTIRKFKNPTNGLNNRLERTGERNSEL